MPSTGQSFDELTSYISNETMLPTSNAWNSPTPYSNGHASYATTAPTSQPYYRPTVNTGRGHQNLPSLTEMNLSNNAPTFSSRPASMPRQHTSNGYYATSTTDPLEISYNKNGQSGYGSSFGVVSNSRSQYLNSYNDWSPISDTYCYSNGHSWPPTMQCSSYVNSDTSSLHSGRRRRGNLPKQVTDILRSWFHEHLDHPYPTDDDKQMLIMKTGLTISQISNWFINARRRHWPQLKQQRDQQMHKLPPRLPGNGGPH